MERRRRRRGPPNDRRGATRARFGAVFLNKYINGTPHAVTRIDLSPNGMLVQKLLEPDVDRAFYAIELGIPWRLGERNDERMWIWTRRVRDLGDRQPLRFMGLGDAERERLLEIVHEARRPT